MKLTITRALNEIKLLKSRYQNQVRELAPIAVQHGLKLRSPYSSYKPEDFASQVKPSMQSVEDLWSRIIEIKTKIDQSNMTTIVKIGTSEMTVQEALVMKNFISEKELLLSKLKNCLRSARAEYDCALEDNRKKVERTVSENTAATGNGSAKVDPDLEKRAIDQVENLYNVKFIDPLSLESLVKQLETEVEEFKNNVDFALSESNSTTFIEISD